MSTRLSAYSDGPCSLRTTWQYRRQQTTLQPWTYRPQHFRNRSLMIMPLTPWIHKNPSNEAALLDIVDTEVEPQAVSRPKDSASTALEKTFVNTVRAANDSVASWRRSNLYGPTDVWMCRMIESGQLNFYLKTRLNSFADSVLLTESIIKRNMNKKSFIAPVAQVVKNTVLHRCQVATAQARFRKAVRALHDHVSWNWYSYSLYQHNHRHRLNLQGKRNKRHDDQEGRIVCLYQNGRTRLCHFLRMCLRWARHLIVLVDLSPSFSHYWEVLYDDGLPHVQASQAIIGILEASRKEVRQVPNEWTGTNENERVRPEIPQFNS